MKTIGIIGGGQLGMMLCDAAHKLGFATNVYSPEADCPAARVARSLTVAAYDDTQALTAFAQSVDVVTFEFENIPPASLDAMKAITPVYPDPKILALSRNRNFEKHAINHFYGHPTAPHLPVNSAAELCEAMVHIGTPSVLKTAEMGYDGKGQIKLKGGEDAALIWQQMGGVECILEGWVPFEREISVIVARDAQGNIACYDPVENIHRNHMLYKTIAPAQDRHDTACLISVFQQAHDIATSLAEMIELVGLLAVEMFVQTDGLVLVNELAPRPHNSGHWTIEGAATSQFEQQIRAVAGLPLGDTKTIHPCEMINLIGEEVHDLAAYQANPNAHIHLYGKKEARAGRKMGHVTIVASS